jgi:PAS domain S-box-containing protein
MRFAVRSRGRAASFFRDAAGLKSLQRLARARLETLSPGAPLRVWVPQCAGGEDAYSVAICLFEAFGSHWREIPLYVFSTDADADALARARAGRYAADAGRGIPREKLARYFVSEHGRIRVRPFVRDACRFVSHHPAQNPPFSRLDLIVGRATLAALPSSTREDALRAFHFALAPGGVLLDRTRAAAGAPHLFKLVKRDGSYVMRTAASRADARGVARIPAADASLRESEEKLRFLLAQTEEAVLAIDGETDLILEANGAAQLLFGFSAPELMGFRTTDLLAAPEAVRRPKNERRSEERLRLPHYRRKDGTLFCADISKTFLMLKGRPCSLWLVRDAAPRLRMNSVRRSAEAREAFVGDIVHELRSPIAVIRGSVETLRKGVRGKRARAAFLQFIENHAGRMAGLVDQLLDLDAARSAKRDPRPAPVLLSDALWEIVAAFAPVAKRRGIVIRIDITGNLAVLADPADIPHLFGNLIDNALKFTPRGGEVHIRGRAENGEGVLSVRDTGFGIAPENLSRIFERFFRGARARRKKGTGLGLAIVQRIVQANGGRVVAENSPSGGAIFRVALPLAKGIKR